jgi:serine/threonine-protein kinase
MAFCHECGVNVAPDNPYCGNCGAALQDGAVRGPVVAAVAPDEGGAAAAPAHPAPTAAQMEDTETPDKPATVDAASVETLSDEDESEEAAGVEAAKGAADASSNTSSNLAAESSKPVDDSSKPSTESAPQLNETFAPAKSRLPDADKSTGEIRRERDAGGVPPTARSGSTGGRQATSKQLEAGTILNSRYEIVRRIGGGGMGAVYLAKDHNLGDAPRAVKEMVESHIDDAQHEKAIGDFKRESLLLTSLEHSSIPTIYDYFYDDAASRFYLVMRYISGGDFAARLRNAPGGRIDEKTVTDWGVQIADVLDYLHKRPKPIIYRDLKPANLMIDGNSGRVMLIDFGIARWVTPQEKGVTAVGTMGYAPPELFSGKVEPRSDIYSLGATMFHLLTGSDPQDNPLLIFDFTKNPRPRQINPAISNEMERILMRAVEYKPEGRFRSAGEMREALMAHLERLRAGDVSYGATSAQNLGGETIQTEMVFCGFCGGRIAADDVFCAHCGAKQPLVGIGSSAALRTARATARLIVAGTTELDVSFHLQKEDNLVGRSDPHSNIFPEVDLSKFDPETKVSRRHARIWRKGDQFLIEDLNSVNGTVINDAVRLAPRQPRVLESGDKLRLGETTLHFLVG